MNYVCCVFKLFRLFRILSNSDAMLSPKLERQSDFFFLNKRD